KSAIGIHAAPSELDNPYRHQVIVCTLNDVETMELASGVSDETNQKFLLVNAPDHANCDLSTIGMVDWNATKNWPALVEQERSVEWDRRLQNDRAQLDRRTAAAQRAADLVFAEQETNAGAEDRDDDHDADAGWWSSIFDQECSL